MICLKEKVDMPSLKVNRTRLKLPENMLVSEICMFLAKFLVLHFKIFFICFSFTLLENFAEGSRSLNRSLLRPYCVSGTGMG